MLIMLGCHANSLVCAISQALVYEIGRMRRMRLEKGLYIVELDTSLHRVNEKSNGFDTKGSGASFSPWIHFFNVNMTHCMTHRTTNLLVSSKGSRSINTWTIPNCSL